MDAVDFLSSIVDEVSLEGLDGITLPMLWFRLKNRPHFPLSLDEDSKIFLWECIAIHKEIEIYELPEPRPNLTLFNRFDNVDSDTGVAYEPENLPKDIYSVQQVLDGEVRGSCSTYQTRKCITSDIRYDNVLLLSLTQVIEQWGDSLVLVASPKCRLLALTGTAFNPLTEITTEEYCLLERIGRSRYLGETSHGDSGLLVLKASFSKQLHYYRTKLGHKGLATRQMFYLKNRKGNTINGRIFHLPRFYVHHKSKMQTLVKNICDFLLTKPNQCEETKVLREKFKVKEKTFKRVFHSPFNKWLKLVSIRYRGMYPDALPKVYMQSKGQERLVKVIKLVKPYDEEDDEECTEETNKIFDHYYFDSSKLYHDLPLTTQAYLYIKSKGPEGMSLVDLTRIMTFPRLDTRSIVKTLSKKGIVLSYLKDRGKQKERRYVAKEFAELNNCEEKGKSNGNLSSTKTSAKKRPIKEDSFPPKSKKVKFDKKVDTVIFEKEDDAKIPIVKESSISDLQNIVADVIQMQNVGNRTGKQKENVSDTPDGSNEKVTINNVKGLSSRFIKRANLILNFVKSVQLTTILEIQKYLLDKEKEEGYSFKLDKKSTARIINKLSSDNQIKLFKSNLDIGDDTKHVELICDTSMENNDCRIQAAIDEAKFKYYGNKAKKTNNAKETSISSEKVLVANENIVAKDLSEKTAIVQPIKRKFFYGLQPKFIRAKTMHLFLCYLTHGYEGSLKNSEEPLIYHNSVTWKRFVPPLTDYNKKEGWCFLADVISRMPLSIFLRVVNIRYEIPGIDLYLGQEEKEHYLIKHLSRELRNNLLQNRKYIFTIAEVIKTLCYMGLVTFGPQVQNLKDQIYAFIHKETKLLDTTISTPGYIYIDQNLNYPTKYYKFNNVNDVDTYWIDLETICLHTPLGRYGTISGKTLTIIEASHKADMIEALMQKDFCDVQEGNPIPGDGLGAAGFDSSLFSHLKRNWCWGSVPWKNADKKQANEALTLAKCPMQSLLRNAEHPDQKKADRLQRLTKNAAVLDLKENKSKSPSILKNSNKTTNKKIKEVAPTHTRKRGLRTVSRKDMKKPRRPYYDEKDKDAIKKMSKYRCDWTAQEDSFLLLCKVASTFLDPNARRLIVPYTVVRDLLQEHLPELAANKSSKACQRRIMYMMRNPTTSNNVAVFLGESRHDKCLVGEFSGTKPPSSNLDEWAKLFTLLVKKMMAKFTMSASDRCKYITLPQTLSEFNELYLITSPHNIFSYENPHEDPKTVNDIYCSTLYSLVLSSMAIVDEGSKWSYTLHKLYENYPDTLLRSIVSKLRKEKIIAAKKTSSKRELQRVHSSSIPFNFSITYENNLITKFPRKIYSECSSLINKLIATDVPLKFELNSEISCGCTATILSLLITNDIHLQTEIPDQVILFDTTLSKEARSNIVERMIHTLSSQESDELSKILNNEISSENQCLQQKCQTDNSQAVVLDEVKNLKTSAEIASFMNASRYALFLLRQEYSQPPVDKLQHSQDYIVLNSCKVYCKLVQGKTHSNDSYPILSKEITESNLEVKHIDSFNIDGDLTTQIMSSFCSYIPKYALSIQNYSKILEITYQEHSPEDLHDGISIFNRICQSEDLGVFENVIFKEFQKQSGNLTVFQHLHILKKKDLVIRVGVSSFKYVANVHSEHWLIHSFKRRIMKTTSSEVANKNETGMLENKKKLLSDIRSNESNSIPIEKIKADTSSFIASNDIPQSNIDEDYAGLSSGASVTLKNDVTLTDSTLYQDVHFIARTWRKPDGSLNVSILLKILMTVLSYIISTPGVTEQKVCERFSGVMQPVQTLELIEFLEKIHCICKYFCKPVKKRSLFSSLTQLHVSQNREPDDVVHLESLPHAIFKMSKLKTCMQEFDPAQLDNLNTIFL